MEKVLGIEITEDKIKILEVGLSDKGFELCQLEKIAIPFNEAREGMVLEQPKVVSNLLSAFIKEKKVTAKKTVALIGMPYVFTRILRLPQNLSDSQIRLNLEAEISQYQLFGGQDNILDFRVIEEISEEGIRKVNVLFGVASRVLAESYLKMTGAAGLDLIGIDVPIFSLIRLLDGVDFTATSLDVTLLVLLREKHVEMCVLKGNRPRFLHSVEMDMREFDEKHTALLDRLVSAIRLVVNFYQARYIFGEVIKHIVINSLDPEYETLPFLMQERLPQHSVRVSQSLKRMQMAQQVPFFLKKLQFDYSCLLGAALRAEEKGLPFDLNLLFEQRRTRQSYRQQMQMIFFSLVFVFTVTVIASGWVLLKTHFLRKKIGHFNEQLMKPSGELNQALGIQEERKVVNKQVQEASLIWLQTKESHYFRNIAKISMYVPGGLWLRSVTNEKRDKDFVIHGEALKEKLVFDYINSLSADEDINQVNLVSSKSQEGTIRFTLQCSTK